MAICGGVAAKFRSMNGNHTKLSDFDTRSLYRLTCHAVTR